MASSSRATTSSISSNRRPSSSSYDVFINFRGPDTRTNFVSLLYRNLVREGIQVFIDSEELWEGEEICPSLLRAIRGSSISIPVFSKNYADSKYCLLELAEMWECHLSRGQTILPIFIDVEPRDVRHQTGSFDLESTSNPIVGLIKLLCQNPIVGLIKLLFQNRQRKYEPDDVKSWKNALTEVGKLKGWTLKGDATIE
ncbi:disease resistance protein L6-like [Telopea speciosissima]|uniref:disease resistance protein L6-like n=1 Tax=Telopea speciosissima TaxID=54955 RepID=UPI001CC6306C|nr:disease resistance protein L6-like [Telopea speciosissima]